MFFPRAGPQGARIDEGNVGHLIDRHQGPVIIHLDVIQKADVARPVRTFGQIGFERFQGALHLLCSAVFSSIRQSSRSPSAINQRTLVFAADDALQRTGLEDGKHVDGQFLVAAQGERRGIHDREVAGEIASLKLIRSGRVAEGSFLGSAV